jgi:glycosyltransferase involved in cell wall biosynthesis
VFPAYTANPYLDLMQRAPRDSGFEFVTLKKLDALYAKGSALDQGDVFHLHWTSPIAQRAADENAASASVATFSRFVDDLKARGVRIVWTVHNRLPHEVPFLEPELELNRFLATRADIVHVMSEQTADVVDDLYPLPGDKVRVIPLPSFHGVYEGVGPTRLARERLGLAPDEATVLFFGRMRAYKGFDTLAAAVDRISERGVVPPTILLAGPVDLSQRDEIERRMPARSRVISHFGHVDAADVHWWFEAADVAAFPFRTILNSSSVNLAATFGVPVILPGEPHLRAQFDAEPWARFYDVDDAVASLADHLIHPDPSDHVASMEAFTLRHSPSTISRRYADLLLEITG